jgi:hypothetical protein
LGIWLRSEYYLRPGVDHFECATCLPLVDNCRGKNLRLPRGSETPPLVLYNKPSSAVFGLCILFHEIVQVIPRAVVGQNAFRGDFPLRLCVTAQSDLLNTPGGCSPPKLTLTPSPCKKKQNASEESLKQPPPTTSHPQLNPPRTPPKHPPRLTTLSNPTAHSSQNGSPVL